ncbi:MAG: hypothetical protein JST10_08895 [Bacteroidetes bacterium]|nr:hypothetical protein [Bacteroidota bacterium]MBS1632675.1 hypothetical protein [Bacteroidota bacterium]
MKKIKLIQMALLSSVIVLLVSCAPGRVTYHERYPASRTSVSLVISPWPGMMISHYPDGRYYYRSPEGFIYWKGFNNRFYIDRSYINRVHYSRREYNEWKNYDKRYNGRRYHR